MAHEVDIHIGHKIREARLLTNGPEGGLLTQTELGDAVGVSFQQIQKYENGSNRVSGSRLYMIAAELKRPISFFFHGLDGGEPMPAIPDNAILMAKLLHELPDGDMKKQVYKLIKSFHSAGMAS